METDFYNNLRESERIGLVRFVTNMENNHYDAVSNNLITNLEEQIENLQKEIESEPKDSGYMNHMQLYFLKKEIFAVAEMKIIYAYKHFEIHLKWLLKASYPEIKERKLYRWESITEFLKSKKINPKTLTNYSEINELRNLNNAIKHGISILDENTSKIQEFQNRKKLDYDDLVLFYKRIEISSIRFIESLIHKIHQDLYEFDEDRIEKMSKKLIRRMDLTAINLLIEKLKKKIE